MEKQQNIFGLITSYIANRCYTTEAEYSNGDQYFISDQRKLIEKTVRAESFDPNQCNENGSPLLNEIAKDIRLLWLVRPILGDPNLRLPVTDENGNNPYQIAIKYGNQIAADLLFDKFGRQGKEIPSDYATFFQCQKIKDKEFFYVYRISRMEDDEKIIKAKLVLEGDPIYDKTYKWLLREGYPFKHKPYAAVVNIKDNDVMGWFMEPTDQLDMWGTSLTTNPYLFAYDQYCKAKCQERYHLSELEKFQKELEDLSKAWFNSGEYLGHKKWDIE